MDLKKLAKYCSDFLPSCNIFIAFCFLFSDAIKKRNVSKVLSFVLFIIESLTFTRLPKLLANKLRFACTKRPGSDSYKGMPSNHTSAAIAPLIYLMHVDNAAQAILLIQAANTMATMWSRIKLNKHSTAQVSSSVILVYLYHRLINDNNKRLGDHSNNIAKNALNAARL